MFQSHSALERLPIKSSIWSVAAFTIREEIIMNTVSKGPNTGALQADAATIYLSDTDRMAVTPSGYVHK
jgi:hypothetical protein